MAGGRGAWLRRRRLLQLLIRPRAAFRPRAAPSLTAPLARRKHNDTAAIQRTIEAAAATGRGSVALLPSNGTYRLGGGLHLLGHAYDGVTLQVDGHVTVPDPSWSTQAQCGFANASAATPGFPQSLCAVLMVINVDGFRFRGHGSFAGYLFDEHKCAPTKTVPKPCPPRCAAAAPTPPHPAGVIAPDLLSLPTHTPPRPGLNRLADARSGFFMVNCTDIIFEDLHLSHFPGMAFIHNSQGVLVRNLTMINRDNPEETGDIEIGGIGSHGEPWNSPWQYEVPLMQASNITIRDLFVTGGDDNGEIARLSAVTGFLRRS